MGQVTKPLLKDETMRRTESGVVKTTADLLAEIRDAVGMSTPHIVSATPTDTDLTLVNESGTPILFEPLPIYPADTSKQYILKLRYDTTTSKWVKEWIEYSLS